MFEAITLDHVNNSHGIPEDAFGVIGNRLFIAISIGGFQEYQECLVFIIHKTSILVKREKVKIIQNFHVTHLNEIDTKNNKILSILTKIKEFFNVIQPTNNNYSLINILSLVLRKLYASLTKHFKGAKYLNLKQRGYEFILNTTYKQYYINMV